MGTINSTVAFDSHNSGWIQGPLNPTMQVLSATLPNVDTGTVVEVELSGSARGSFYYAIVETTGGAKEIAPSTRVLMTDDTWAAIETSTFYEAERFQDLNFAVSLNKGDFSGDMTIYNLTLLAKIV
jgi:hypothetical protein